MMLAGRTLGSTIVGGALTVYIVWIFLAGAPEERMSRACHPTQWLGNLGVSFMALLGSAGGQREMAAWADKFDYGCQYTLWRLLYEEEWKAQQEAGGPPPKTGGAPTQANEAPAVAPIVLGPGSN